MEKNYPNLVLDLVSNYFCKLFLLSFLFSTSFIYSQTPSDDCTNIANSSQLTVGTSCNYVTFNSDNGTDYWNSASGCNAQDRDDAWGWFIATSTTTTITYNPFNGRDAILHLFTGSCSTNMTAIACADDYGNNGAETITYNTNVGQKYMIRIQRSGSNSSMNGQICVYSPSCDTTPTYCTTTFPDGIRPITNVTFAGINNNSIANSYLDYEKFCNTASVTAGSTYQISVTVQATAYQQAHIYAYFDWNQNGNFNDSNEYYYIGYYILPFNTTATIPVNITVPSGATLGTTTMRVGHKLYNNAENVNNLIPCNFWGYGQAEDYFVNVAAAPPSITSFSPITGGCVGSTITINGSGLSNATSVTIGNTAATILTNSANVITATVGTGTTGTVKVTTAAGTATSLGSFTVYALPANPGNPTSNSPQCSPSNVTITRNGTPPSGVTWYWQTSATGTSTANSGATYTVSASGTYYIRAVNSNGCWSNGAGSVTVAVLSTPSITTNPANSTISAGSNTSLTVAA